MDEALQRIVRRLRQAAETRPNGDLYVKVYWRDVIDVVNCVEHQDKTIGNWARQLTRQGYNSKQG